MKKIFLTALLALSIFLTSCGGLVKLTPTADGYEDKKNDIVYHAAPAVYEPRNIGEEYASYKSAVGEVVLYSLGELPTSEWLTEKYDGIGSIYYASNVTLPTFAEFEPNAIYVCVEEVITMHMQTIDNQAAVERVARIINESEPVDMPMGGVNTYHLKFTSAKYPELYYNILYIIDADGSGYYYDRSTKCAYKAGDSLAGFIYMVEEE